jgi:hypothetical protein
VQGPGLPVALLTALKQQWIDFSVEESKKAKAGFGLPNQE